VKGNPNRLIVADKGWAETIPDWILKEIEVERTVEAMAEAMGRKIDEVGDAEAVAYLYTLSLKTPFDYTYTKIYTYLVAKLMKKRNPNNQLPDFMEKALQEGLDDYEKRELARLKQELKRKRGPIYHPLFEALKQLRKEIMRGKRHG